MTTSVVKPRGLRQRLCPWLRAVFQVMFPIHSRQWHPMPYQPFLFTSLWMSGLVLMLFGDLTTWPLNVEPDTAMIMPSTWVALLVIAPPLGFASSWLLANKRGKWRYRAFWLRLFSDFTIATALAAYLAARIELGHYHVLLLGVLSGSTLFSVALVYRDLRLLVASERLAKVILRTSRGKRS